MPDVVKQFEAMLEAAPARTPVEARVDVLTPMADYLSSRRGKTTDPKCTCQDEDYLNVYREKHRTAS